MTEKKPLDAFSEIHITDLLAKIRLPIYPQKTYKIDSDRKIYSEIFAFASQYLEKREKKVSEEKQS